MNARTPMTAGVEPEAPEAGAGLSPVSVYLASRSPRRQDLLRQIGIRFDMLVPDEAAGKGADVNEDPRPGELPADYVRRIARTKAIVAWQRMRARGLAERPVLAADTTVALGEEILGKPYDVLQAGVMLRRLSGATHEVFTAVAVAWEKRVELVLSRSTVTMREISSGEVDRYVATGEGSDKAGAYAIQGIASVFISRIEGSYSGIVGLPLAETALLLERAGCRVL